MTYKNSIAEARGAHNEARITAMESRISKIESFLWSECGHTTDAALPQEIADALDKASPTWREQQAWSEVSDTERATFAIEFLGASRRSLLPIGKAWGDVLDALNKYAPGWRDADGSVEERVVAAVRTLAEYGALSARPAIKADADTPARPFHSTLADRTRAVVDEDTGKVVGFSSDPKTATETVTPKREQGRAGEGRAAIQSRETAHAAAVRLHDYCNRNGYEGIGHSIGLLMEELKR